MMKKEITIKLKDVSFSWPVHNKKNGFNSSLKSSLIGGGIGCQKNKVSISALKDISFTLESGDRLGLIGRNGGGKSTLLRILAGTLFPSSGDITVQGKIATLFTNAIGLHQEATGYENIFMMSKLLGVPCSTARVKAIEDFTELGSFLNLPLRTFSAGMRTRLGFAIATSIESDILLIDEIIGAGDQGFQKKASQLIKEKIQDAGILVIASHDSSVLSAYCNKALWIENGSIRKFGLADEVLNEFQANTV